MGEDRDANNAGGAVERVTIAQAATLLGCHHNTVRSRVKAGMYRAEKVVTENGPTWMIDRDSLITNAPTSASQQPVSGVPAGQQEAIQELTRAIVREAGLAKDPEEEARVEATKLAAESAKTNVLLSSGALVGIATLVGVLPSNKHPGWVLIGILLVSISVLVGFRRMEDLAEKAAARREPTFGSWGATGPPLLVMGLVAFSFYVLYNIPWNHEGRFIDLTRDQFVWGSILLAALLAALILGGHNLLKRVRRPANPEADD